MRRFLGAILALALVAPGVQRAAEKGSEDGFVALFNGKDLTGWKAIDTALFGSKGAVTKIYNAGGRK